MLDREKLLEDLTEEQRQAVTHTEGPLLIIAGAGSGKTRVITRRVGYLMSLGITPWSILAITFTNKAAGEMKSRVGALLGRDLQDWGRLDQPHPVICTFHSLCLRILRHYAQPLGLPPNFSVYDSDDQEKLIKQAIQKADLSATNFPPSMVHAKISDAKNRLRSVQQYTDAARDFNERGIARIYSAYQKLLQQNNALDFDDLLMRTAEAFRTHPDILRQLQERFAYILIDEYQDTNHAQYLIAHLLAMKHHNICVVGDPDQSIYAWRGADIQNILDFEKDYPNAAVVRLERNYRSTKCILRIASRLIARNRKRKEKALWTENADGEKADVLVCADEHAEALAVAGRLRELAQRGHAWNQMAIFYRVNSLSRVMEDALRRSGVPYRIARGVDFYHRREIKDVLAYLRVIVNPADEVSLDRIVNTPARGISDATVKQLQKHATAGGTSLWQAMQEAMGVSDLQDRARRAVLGFVELVRGWQRLAGEIQAQAPVEAQVENSSPGRVRRIMEHVVGASGLEAYYDKLGGEEKDELANIGELITAAAEYDRDNPRGTLEDYLARVSLVSDQDMLKETGGAVTLMTLHAAKGLEFPVVAIIGMEEQLLPHARVSEHPEQLEEERRLCFVGITRARERLILSRAGRRMFRGSSTHTIASRFLAEMPREDLDVLQTEDGLDDDQAERGEEEESTRASAFRRGMLVRHPQFGIGRIVEMARLGQDTRVVVEFQRAGRKTLILRYARLEPVG